MTFSFFSKKEEPKEEPNHMDKVIPLSYSEITVRLNKRTGVTTVVSFRSPLMAESIYPKCWVPTEGTKIDAEFDEILKEQIPYDDADKRREFIVNMNKLLNVFNRAFKMWDKDDTYIKEGVYNFLKSLDWEYGISIVNIFMECTVKWLLLQEQKFNDLHSQEPELKLTDEEYEAILKSMQRLNTVK